MNTTIATTIIITSIIRSARVCKGEQQNLATAFLDGSQIYGGVRRSQSSCKDCLDKAPRLSIRIDIWILLSNSTKS